MDSTLQGLTPNTWPVGTEVVLMQVPWDASYRDVVIWDSQSARDDYMDANYDKSRRWTSKKFSYLKPGEPIRVPVPYSAAYKYNYLWVQNPVQPVEDEEQPLRLCYFITSSTYINPQTTEFTLQLDLFQTYQFDVRLGNMYVERGHFLMSVDRYKAGVDKLQGEWLRRELNVPEGLDVGDSYVMCNHEWYPLTEAETGELGKIIVVSSADLAADPGTVDNPSLNVSDGQYADGLPSGCNVYSMDLQTFRMMLKEMKNKSWVAQCIQSISTFPARLLSAGVDVQLFGGNVTIQFIGETDTLDSQLQRYAETGNIFQQLSNGVPAGFHEYYKAYTYPYSVIELTAFNGNSVFLKPQNVIGNTLSLFVCGCAVAPFARAGVFPQNYGIASDYNQPVNDNRFDWVGFDSNAHGGRVFAGDFLDSCLWISDFPQFSIVNSNYTTFLASTAHTRAYQYDAAGWANAKSNASADLAYTQAMNQAALNDAQRYELNPDLTPQIARGYSDLTGQASKVMTGWGGATSANEVNTLGLVEGVASYLSSRLSGNQSYEAGQALTRQVAGQNLDYAKWAAQGDYANQIASIQATVQDAAIQAPSTLGQMGGQGFMWKQGLVGFAVNYKCVGGAAMQSVCQFWGRYGYKSQRFFNFNGQDMRAMHVMDKFSYWKVSESYITCSTCNEAEKDAMRGAMEKGVTLWHAPGDIGNVRILDNKPLYNVVIN